MSKQSIGNISVLLYAGLPGERPIEVGRIYVPVFLDDTKHIKADDTLREAIDYTGESLKSIFRDKGKDTGE